jgi:glutathione S-transferase
MPTILGLPAFQPLALFSVLLILKMAAVAFVTANMRRKSQVVLNPEDTKVNPGSHAEPQEAATTMRAKRAHLNDLENIPSFLFMAFLYTLAGGSSTGGWAYFGLYFAARTLHTIFYLSQAQPWRTMAFAVGQITLLGLLVQVLLKAFH